MQFFGASTRHQLPRGYRILSIIGMRSTQPQHMIARCGRVTSPVAQLRLSDGCGMMSSAAIGRKWGTCGDRSDSMLNFRPFSTRVSHEMTLNLARTLLASIRCSYVGTALIGVVNCDSLHQPRTLCKINDIITYVWWSTRYIPL